LKALSLVSSILFRSWLWEADWSGCEMSESAWPDDLFETLLTWKSEGLQTLPGGARRIGYVPHVGSEAYLHCIPAPLSTEEVQELEMSVGRTFRPEFKSFLRHANGLKVFSGALGIYGLRSNYAREPVSMAASLPFDIRTPNVRERPKGLHATDVVVGSYGEDGSEVVLKENGSVIRVARRTGEELNGWPSFEYWLNAEVARLCKMFDAKGRCLDNARILPTT